MASNCKTGIVKAVKEQFKDKPWANFNEQGNYIDITTHIPSGITIYNKIKTANAIADSLNRSINSNAQIGQVFYVDSTNGKARIKFNISEKQSQILSNVKDSPQETTVTTPKQLELEFDMPTSVTATPGLTITSPEDLLREADILSTRDVQKRIYTYTDVVDIINEQLKVLNRRLTAMEKSFAKAPNKELAKNITELEKENTKLKKTLGLAIDAANPDDLLKITARNHEELEQLSAKDMSDAELLYANQLINKWEEFLDWSNPDNLLFNEDERESPYIQEQFQPFLNDIKNKYKPLVSKLMRQRLVNLAQKESADLTESDLYKQSYDSGDLAALMLDLSRTDEKSFSILSKIIARTHNKHLIEAQDRFKQLQSKIDKALPFLKKIQKDYKFKDLYDVFYQRRRSMGQTLYTSNLVFHYSQNYHDEIDNQSRIRDKAIAKAEKLKGVAKSKAINEAVKAFKKWQKDNTIDIDVRYLFPNDTIIYPGFTKNPAFTGTVSISKDKQDEYKEKLIKTIGEKQYNRIVKMAEEKLNNYNEMYEYHKEDAELKVASGELTDEQAKKNLRLWEIKNSPYFAAAQSDALDSYTYEGEHIWTSHKFMRNVPIKYDSKGDETGWYDNQMELIEKTPEVEDLYNEMLSILHEMKSYLPGYVSKDIQLNTIPFMSKTISENYMSGSLAKLKLSPIIGAVKDLLLEKDVDFGTDKNNREIYVNFLSTNKAKIDEITNIRVNSHILRNGAFKSIAGMMDFKAEVKKQVTDELFKEENTKDLGRVLKYYLGAVLSYKYRVENSDQIAVIEQALIPFLQTSALEKKGVLSKLKKTSGIDKVGPKANKLQQMIYALDVFQGKAKINKSDIRFGKDLKQADKAVYDEYVAAKKLAEGSLKAGKIDQDTYEMVIKEYDSNIRDLYSKYAADNFGEALIIWQQALGLAWNIKSFFANRMFGLIANIIQASDGRSFSYDKYWEGFRIVNSRSSYSLMYGSAYTGFAFGAIIGTPLIGGLIGAGIGTAIGYTAKKILDLSSPNNATIKLGNIMERWDILKKAQDEMYKASINSSFNSATNLITEPMGMYKATAVGEWINQAEVAYAMLASTNLKDKDGKDVNMFQALNEDGTWNYTLMGDKIMSPFSKTEIEGEAFIEEMKISIDQTIAQIHGNYDANKLLKIKSNVLGRLAIQFRTWIGEGYAIRYEEQSNDYLLNNIRTNETFQVRKGRYNSVSEVGGTLGISILGGTTGVGILSALSLTMPFLAPFIGIGGLVAGGAIGTAIGTKIGVKKHGFEPPDIEGTKFFLKQLARKVMFKPTSFNDRYNQTDAANLRAVATEITMYASLVMTYGLIKALQSALDGDDDDEYARTYRFVLNNIKRGIDDLQLYINPIAAQKILFQKSDSIFPAISIVNNLLKGITQLLTMETYKNTDPSQGYKEGDLKAINSLSKIVPLQRQLQSMETTLEKEF